MTQRATEATPTILYVDDEEQSLKYFRIAFEREFRVLTAASVAAAEELLEREGARIAIVLTDQRMPGQLGTDLLAKIRRNRPSIVRILTTAYSDLESAIDAVNEGAIFKYVVKPWDLRELRGALVSANELFQARRHRDLLLREKMSVIERMVVADRVRSLAVLAAGLGHQIRNPLTALSTFLEQAPAKLRAELPASRPIQDSFFWEDFWSLARREGERILRIVQQVTDVVVEPQCSFGPVEAIDAIVSRAARGAEAEGLLSGPVNVGMEPGVGGFRGDGAMLERMFRVLVARVAEMGTPGEPIRVAVSPATVAETAGLGVLVVNDGPPWPQELVDRLFVPFAMSDREFGDLGLDLLCAFFIAQHHGGEIRIRNADAGGQGFDVRLPLDPDLARRPTLAFESDCLRRIYADLAAHWE